MGVTPTSPRAILLHTDQFSILFCTRLYVLCINSSFLKVDTMQSRNVKKLLGTAQRNSQNIMPIGLEPAWLTK